MDGPDFKYYIETIDARFIRIEDKIDKLMESRALSSFLIAFGTSIIIAVIQFFLIKRPGG